MTETDPDKRILQEEIMGVIPAATLSEKGPQVQCGLVFATSVLIVALLTDFREIWWATKTPRYYALKRDWARYEHKPTASILQSKHYKCYIIPHSNTTHVNATETRKATQKDKTGLSHG